MPKYLKTNSTSKQGVNYIRTIVESQNSIFNEIPVQNDLGIDGIIEIIKNEYTTSKLIAIQIKTGKSYYNKGKKSCKIPVESHFNYWINYPLPVIGIVYIPDENIAYWVDIKDYLEIHGKVSSIKFHANEFNIFCQEDFEQIFIPLFTNETPLISFERTIKLCESSNYDEFNLGVRVAFWRFGNLNIVWKMFINILIQKDVNEISDTVLYYFGFVVDWADIWLNGSIVTEENKKYFKELLEIIPEDVIIKLIEFINDGNPIGRGSLGHLAERVISNVPNISSKLENIIRKNDLEVDIKLTALSIYASHDSKKTLKLIRNLKEFNKDISQKIIEFEKYLKKYKAIYFYS